MMDAVVKMFFGIMLIGFVGCSSPEVPEQIQPEVRSDEISMVNEGLNMSFKNIPESGMDVAPNVHFNEQLGRHDVQLNSDLSFYISEENDLTPERLEDLSIFLLELLASGKKATKAEEVAIKKVLLYYYKFIRKNHSLASLYQFVDDRKDTLIQAIKTFCYHALSQQKRTCIMFCIAWILNK